MSPQPVRDVTYDAVVVIPGIMGSVLVERATGDTLWGLAQTVKYTRLWLSDKATERLMVTSEEREGRADRVVATGLLTVPAIGPLLRGMEPYHVLVDRLKGVLADPAGVRVFPYDWRLSVEHNAKLLAAAAREHLDRWRGHVVHQHPGDRPEPRLVIVAHSMGGLLARALALVEDKDDVPKITDDIRATVTLGTPFYGAVKAAILIQTGEGTPLGAAASERRMRRLARSFPGVYDLLPFYKCVDERESVRRFDERDAETIGGDRELARRAKEFRALLVQQMLPSHRPMVGTGQKTLHTLRIDNGVAIGEHYDLKLPTTDGGPIERIATTGDETVPRVSAIAGHKEPSYLPQQHGSIQKTVEGVNYAIDVVKEYIAGPRLAGEGELGLDLPDVVAAGEEWTVHLTGVTGVRDAQAVLEETDRDMQIARLHLEKRDGCVVAPVVIPEPGVYRVKAAGGGASAVSQLVLVTDG